MENEGNELNKKSRIVGEYWHGFFANSWSAFFVKTLEKYLWRSSIFSKVVR